MSGDPRIYLTFVLTVAMTVSRLQTIYMQNEEKHQCTFLNHACLDMNFFHCFLYSRKVVQLSHEEIPEYRQNYGFTHNSAEESASSSEMWCVANTWLYKSIREPQIERTTTDPSYISCKVTVLKSCQT